MDKKHNTPTIGLLVSGISEIFTELICKGVMHAVREAGMNLVVLPGRYIDRDLTTRYEIMYEYQYNTIFSYANQYNLDAVIVSAGSIGCYTTEERVRELLEPFSNIPCVLVASKIDGYISVNYDNDLGIRQGIDYMIHKLHCKKICMLGGPDTNTDAYERKQVFLDMIHKNNIPFEDRQFVAGDLSANDEQAFKKLLDENPDMDAVFCVNDNTALGLYDEMQRRNLVPGKDIYVMGYDNTIAGAQAKPSLSTVWADSIELGECAVQMVLRIFSGEEVEPEVIPTRFVRRNSFGSDMDYNEKKTEWLLDHESICKCFDDIFYRYIHEEVIEEITKVREKFEKLMNQLFLFSNSDDFSTEKARELLDSFDEFLNTGMLQYADIDDLLLYFNCIYKAMKEKKANDDNAYAFLECFNEMYRKMVGTMEHRFGVIRRQNEDISYSMKLFVRDILSFEKGNDQSYVALLDNLDWLDVKNAYVYVFEDTIMHLMREDFTAPDKLYLKAVLCDGVPKAIPKVYQETKLETLFDFDYEDAEWYDEERTKRQQEISQMVVLPLFTNENLYGVIILDLTENVFREGEFLTNQMSSAVKMIKLLQINENIQQQLESNLVALREHNIVLDNLSKSDVLTGIYNRRGFFDVAKQQVHNNRKDGKNTIVAYVDMNNLKIINDRYGHEEGDSSLKQIGKTLVALTGQKGIAGRIGGDEFSFIMEYDRDDNGESVLQEIKDMFDSYNHSSPKPYNVTVSVGTHLILAEDSFSLEEALSMADEKLYEAKKYRIKKVAKEEC